MEQTNGSQDRRYTWLDVAGDMKSRPMTDYECQLEDEVQQLQEALFILSSHYAKIQFRLRQIGNATGCERLCLLKELERITCQGLEANKSDMELPQLSSDSQSLGDVRSKQDKIITQLRARLRSLADVAENENLCGYNRRQSQIELQLSEPLYLEAVPSEEQSEEQHSTYCSCCLCKQRSRSSQSTLGSSSNNSAEQRYLSERWPSYEICDEEEETAPTKVKKQRKRKQQKSKHTIRSAAGSKSSAAESIGDQSSKRSSKRSSLHKLKAYYATATAKEQKSSRQNVKTAAAKEQKSSRQTVKSATPRANRSAASSNKSRTPRASRSIASSNKSRTPRSLSRTPRSPRSLSKRSTKQSLEPSSERSSKQSFEPSCRRSAKQSFEPSTRFTESCMRFSARRSGSGVGGTSVASTDYSQECCLDHKYYNNADSMHFNSSEDSANDNDSCSTITSQPRKLCACRTKRKVSYDSRAAYIPAPAAAEKKQHWLRRICACKLPRAAKESQPCPCRHCTVDRAKLKLRQSFSAEATGYRKPSIVSSGKYSSNYDDYDSAEA